MWVIIILIGIIIFLFWLYSLNYQFSKISSKPHHVLFRKYKEEMKKSFEEFTANLNAIEELKKEQLQPEKQLKQKLTKEQFEKIETQIKEYSQTN